MRSSRWGIKGWADWPPHRPGREGRGGTGSPSGFQGLEQVVDLVERGLVLVSVLGVGGDRGGGKAGGAGGELVTDLLHAGDVHRRLTVAGQQREARLGVVVLVLLGAVVEPDAGGEVEAGLAVLVAAPPVLVPQEALGPVDLPGGAGGAAGGV